MRRKNLLKKTKSHHPLRLLCDLICYWATHLQKDEQPIQGTTKQPAQPLENHLTEDPMNFE